MAETVLNVGDWSIEKHQRTAAADFLRATQTDPALRRRVAKSGDDDRRHAWDQLRTRINIPEDVEVICLEPTTMAREKVVVLVLPNPADPPPIDLAVLKYWLAAWVPYNP